MNENGNSFVLLVPKIKPFRHSLKVTITYYIKACQRVYLRGETTLGAECLRRFYIKLPIYRDYTPEQIGRQFTKAVQVKKCTV